MRMVTESIFSGDTTIIPMADVQHIERHWYTGKERTRTNFDGIQIITKHTRWDMEADTWANNIYLSKVEADAFMKAWCRYRSELESVYLADLAPDLDAVEECPICGSPIVDGKCEDVGGNLCQYTCE